MTEEVDIAFPVRFNAFKHHRNYILAVLKSASPEWIANQLDPICNNYIDIYCGTMTPEAIGHAVIDNLKSNKVLRWDDFTPWIESKNGYQHIKLEDQSEWVVRKSNEDDRYIHLHPARTGPLSMRFKGSTLKTVYLLKINHSSVQDVLSVERVNRIRSQIGLSPIKKLDPGKGILYCFEKFFPSAWKG